MSKRGKVRQQGGEKRGRKRKNKHAGKRLGGSGRGHFRKKTRGCENVRESCPQDGAKSSWLRNEQRSKALREKCPKGDRNW